MLLFTLTFYGWLFIVVFLSSIFLAAGISRKMFKVNGGCLTFGLVFSVVICINLLFSFFAVDIAKYVYNSFALPKYDAVIVGSKMYNQKDNVGRGFKYKIMYAPVVRFKDSTGRNITVESNIRSESKPLIGKELSVIIEKGSHMAKEVSFKSSLFEIGGGLMILIFAFVIYRAIRYSLSIKGK